MIETKGELLENYLIFSFTHLMMSLDNFAVVDGILEFELKNCPKKSRELHIVQRRVMK